MRYLVFVSDDDRLVNGVRSNGDVTFGNIEITTSLTSCLADEDISFSLDDCTADNFLAAVKAKMESTAACANKSDPLLELFALFDATQETDVYNNIEKVCTGAHKQSGYDVYDAGTLGMEASTERQITAEYLDGGSVWNYAGSNDHTATIERVASSIATSRLLSWPEHHALDHCEVGAAMCCSAVSRTDPIANDPNAEVCYVDIKASKRTARVRDGYSIYTQDQVNDVYCEAFAWGTDGGSMQSALKGNALFQAGFVNMLSGSVEQIPGAPLCGCLDRMHASSDQCQVHSSDKHRLDGECRSPSTRVLGCLTRHWTSERSPLRTAATLSIITGPWRVARTLLSLCMLPGGLLGPQAVPRPPLHSSPAKGLSSAKRY